MPTVKEFLYNDFTACYECNEYQQQANMSKDIDSYKEGEVYYYNPVLCFGDYDNSCAVERANVRVFLERFPANKWVKHVKGSYSSESIGIDIFCDDEEILEVLASLSDYPSLDDQAVAEIEQELKEEAWKCFVERDVIKAIDKKFSVNLDEYHYKDEDLICFFNNAAEKANIYGEVEAGGNYYIDIERVIESVKKLPAKLTEKPV